MKLVGRILHVVEGVKMLLSCCGDVNMEQTVTEFMERRVWLVR